MPEIPAWTLLPGGSTESEPRRSTREDLERRRAVRKPLGPGRGSKRPGVRRNGMWAPAGKTEGRLSRRSAGEEIMKAKDFLEAFL